MPHICRYTAWMLGIYGTVMAISYYVDRNKTHLLGFSRIKFTKEEIKERYDFSRQAARIRRAHLPVEIKGRPRDLYMSFSNEKAEKPLDDGIILNTPSRNPEYGIGRRRA